MKIRFLKDENEIVKLFPIIIAGGAEGGFNTKKLNPDKLWFNLRQCMTAGAIIVADNDSEIIGFISLYPQESYWCDEVDLFCLIYHVARNHRKKTGAGTALLNAAIQFSRDKNMHLYMHVEGAEDMERKCRFFEKYGFKKHSINYVRR